MKFKTKVVIVEERDQLQSESSLLIIISSSNTPHKEYFLQYWVYTKFWGKQFIASTTFDESYLIFSSKYRGCIILQDLVQSHYLYQSYQEVFSLITLLILWKHVSESVLNLRLPGWTGIKEHWQGKVLSIYVDIRVGLSMNWFYLPAGWW